jgi:hypothetical protein
MSIAALITWVITAGLGSYMVATWRRHGGLTNDTSATHLPPARVFTHLGLAVVGLVVWIIFVATDAAVWAWIAVVDLVLVAALGGVMVRRWITDGRLAMAGGTAAPDLAEQHISRPPVVLHGIFAASTVVLVILAAVGVGGG